MTVEDWRRKIDEIDRKLVELLNERSRCVVEIGRLKKDHFDIDGPLLCSITNHPLNHGQIDEFCLIALLDG